MEGGEIFVPKMPSIRITDLARAIAPNCKHRIVGMRPGEKLHETLVPKDDGIYTCEFEDRFITYPYVVERGFKKNGVRLLGLDFEGYTSNNNPHWLGVEQLRIMVKAKEHLDAISPLLDSQKPESQVAEVHCG